MINSQSNNGLNLFDVDDSLVDFYGSSFDPVSVFDSSRYEEKTLIGEGAFKLIYQVTDNHCNRDVALAEIKPAQVSKRYILDFIREVQLASSLEHPNIARVYDVGLNDELPFFTMELIQGETLDLWVRHNEDYSFLKRLNLFTELCNAVSYAHEKRVLHLDIKPQNVHISDHGRILLSDWGVSTYTTKKSAKDDLLGGQHGATHVMGTPGFMAPEQCGGGETSVTTDVFGLGAVLYFLITQKAPFQGEDQKQTIQRTLENRVEPAPTIPPRIWLIIDKSLSSRPSGRYPSVEALKNEVELYLTGHALSSESASVVTQLKLFILRNSRFCIAVLVTVVTAIAITTYYLATLNKEQERTIFERNRAKVEEVIAKQALGDLQKEHQLRLESEKKRSWDLTQQAQSQINDFKLGDAEWRLKLAISLDPKNTEAFYKLGSIKLVKQNFPAAISLLTQATNDRSNPLIELSKKYQLLPRPLSREDTFELVQSATKVQLKLGLLILYRDSEISQPKEHAQLIKDCLKYYNKLKFIHFSYDAKTKKLDLSDNPQLKRLLIPYSVNSVYHLLSSLQIDTLVIKNTPIEQNEIEQLRRHKKLHVQR